MDSGFKHESVSPRSFTRPTRHQVLNAEVKGSCCFTTRQKAEV